MTHPHFARRIGARASVLRAAALFAAMTLTSAHATGFLWNVATAGANNWNVNANWLPATGNPGSADSATFGNLGTAGNATTVNNIVSVNTTVAALSYTNMTSATWHVTQIPAGVTLTVSGATVVGGGTLSGQVTSAALTDAGTLALNGNLTVGNNGSAGADTGTILDLSALTNFVYVANAGTIALASGNRSAADMKLAAGSNFITVGTLNANVASTSSGAGGTLTLGAGTNIINVGTISAAIARNSCTIQFPAVGGGLRLRGVNGADTDRANLTLANRNQNTSGGANSGLLNFNGHPVDIKFGTVTMGQAQAATPTAAQTGLAIINFDTGVIDATTINMAISSANAFNSATGAINIGPNGTLVIGAGGVSLANQGAAGISGGSLSASGTILASGSIVKTTSAGSGSVTLTNGTLTLNSSANTVGTPAIPIDNFIITNATINLAVGATGTNIVVSNFALGGATNKLVFTLLPSIGSYPSQFPIIKYTTMNGAQPDGITSILGASSLPGTFTGYLSNNVASGVIWLVITSGPLPPESIVWQGNVGPDWDTGTINWTNTTGIATNYNQGDFVAFDDTAATTVVNVTTTLAPGTFAVATANTYTFGGSGKISGSTSLAKSGGGTLIFTNAGVNDFSGGVNIGAGVLQVGDGGTVGSLPASGAIVNNGSLVFDRSDNILAANAISGGGTVTNNGAGMVTLSGANSYGGATVLNAGTIRVSSATVGNSSLGAIPGGAVTVASGATLDIGGSGTANNLGFTNAAGQVKQFLIAGAGIDGNGAIVNNGSVNQQNVFQSITLTGDATFGGSARWDMRGNGAAGTAPLLTLGGFKLTKTNANQISLVSATVTSGDIDIRQGTLSVETASSIAVGGTISVHTGGSFAHFRTAAGAITRSIVLDGGTITNLSVSGGSSTDNGPISLTANSFVGTGTGSDLLLMGQITEANPGLGITKVNTGGVYLGGNNLYSGTTLVSQGTLGLTNSGSISASTNIVLAGGAVLSATSRSDATLTLASGQTLRGNGTVQGATVVSPGAVLSPGASVGVLTFNNTLTLQGTTTMEIDKTGSTNDLVNAAGITYGGTLNVTLLSGSYAAGDSFKLFNAGSGSFASIVPASPANNLLWDTSSLATGILKVKTATADVATIALSGSDIVLNVSNGVPGGTFYVLASTNITLPLSDWTAIATNVFDANGNFLNGTIPNAVSGSQQFYILQLP
jgi:fibronectin-binding autotransporter adhesin